MVHFQNSGFYEGAQRIGTFLLANLVTAFLLMTIIGAPFGLLGLFALMNAWVQETQPGFFSVYLGAIRRHWRTALPLGIIDLIFGGVIVFNFSVFPAMGPGFFTILSLTMTFCVCVVLLMTNLYAWSIVSLLNLPFRGTLKLSLYLTLSRPFRSLLVALATLIPLVASLFLPIAFALFLTVSLSGYIGVRGVWWVLRAQFSREELAELMRDPVD